MAKVESFTLQPDKKGAVWDAVLYIPVIALLVGMALQFWYGQYQYVSYILVFSASYIALIGINRVFKSRLMMGSDSPKWLELSKKNVVIATNAGEKVELVSELRYFPDYAGKSFGLAGLDMSGKKRQFVFHRGQFAQESEFKDIRSRLAVFK